nr:MAG: replication polyprotein [Skomarfal virus 55]
METRIQNAVAAALAPKDNRGCHWSITINNPTDTDTACGVPGWKLLGQFEQGEEGTRHFQGYLKTPQVRFSAVKAAFPRAHIELARDPRALQKYVHKEDTRVAEYVANDIPSMFTYQEIVAAAWDPVEFTRRVTDEYENATITRVPRPQDDLAMEYVDSIVATQIEAGQRGAEFIAINPMWRSSWKRFWRSIIARHATQTQQRDQAPPQPPPQDGSPQE